MIPLNAVVTIKHTETDNWGMGVPVSTSVHKAYQNYKMDMRGNETNTRNGTLETLPIGFLMFVGTLDLSHADFMAWTGLDGRELEVRPEDIDFITDLSGKVVYTKVTF